MAISDKDAPYLVTIIFASLGWIVTFIAEQYSAVPTLEIEKTLEISQNTITAAKFKFTNVSRKSAITINKLDFIGDVTLLATKPPCGKFISVAPYRVADLNPPFETAGLPGSCVLPLTLKRVALLPGASFAVQLTWKGEGKLNPFIVEDYAQTSSAQGSPDTNPFRIEWSDSLDARIARNLNAILFFGGILTFLIAIVLIFRRKNKVD